ncbi:MAG: DUF1572 domain-containing protein [Acidobacteria bacterium]|nr:MAG: DUF1572 domain-containing protein [Acidobacteriota bacterium]
MAHEFTTSYLKDSIDLLRHYKRLAERAMAQVPDEAFGRSVGEGSNSIATIVKHLAGNMRSRFTNFLTSDGEKPDRNRDMEFEAPPNTRAEVMGLWETGWECVFTALTPLQESDLARTVLIRTEAHSVMQAINRQIAHYCSHIGQIIYLAKHFAGDQWKAVTVPRGKSAEFTAKVAKGELSQR